MRGGAAGAFDTAPLALGFVTGGELEAGVALEATEAELVAVAAGLLAVAGGIGGCAVPAVVPTLGGALIIPLDGPQLIVNAERVSTDTESFHRTRNGSGAFTRSPSAKRVPTTWNREK